MRNYTIWPSDSVTIKNEQENKIAALIRKETFKLIDSVGGLSGDVLDIGNRNYLTELLEERYRIGIDSTSGDLDLEFNCPKKQYDFVHYNNVIEHQFNPLFTLLEIKKVLKPSGLLILGCPLKPKWITTASCHFHEFDKKAYKEIIDRAELIEIESIYFSYVISLRGIRSIMASFKKRSIVSLLKKGLAATENRNRH